MPLTIAAPPFLVQLFFETKDGHGFSENYWSNKPSYQEALDETLALGSLLDARRAMFTASHHITYVRVSDTTRKRDTLVKGVAPADGVGTYVPAAQDTSPDQVALLVRWQAFIAGIPYFALRPMRLIPEECVTDGVYAPTVAFDAALTNLIAELVNPAKWVMVVKVAGTPTSSELSSVTALHMSQRKAGRPFGQSRGRLVRP